MSNRALSSDFIERLLNLATGAEQEAALRDAGLLDECGLSLLLAETERLADKEPGKARQLSLLCEHVAGVAKVPAAAPHAQYLRAQTYAIHGEFDFALDLIKRAWLGYVDLAMPLEALRTQVGLTNVLDELGRYAEALDVGQAALDEISKLIPHLTHPAPDLQRIAARLHVNRGVSYMQLGRYQEAISAYVIAEALFEALNETEWLANVSNNQGLVLTYLGRVREALAAFERAANLRADTPPSLSHAHTLLNIGEAQRLLGNYAQSLAAFQQANQLLTVLDARVDQQINQLHMADVYLTLNLYPEASAAYGAAEQVLGDLNMIYERGLALWGLGAARLAQGQLAQAELALAEAATLFHMIDNVPLHSSVMLEQAALQALQSQRDAALALAHRALALVAADTAAGEGWPVQQVYAHLRIADLLLPDAAAAEPHLVEAGRLLATLTLPHLRYRLLQRLGHVRLLQGKDEEAQTYLETAIAEIEPLRNALTHEVMRASFLHDKAAAYEDLVRLYLKRRDTQSIRQAFDVAERAQSRALVELLAGIVETKAGAADDPTVTPQLQALQADLNALYNKLLDSSGGADHALSNQHLRTHAAELEQKISWLRLQAAGTTAPAMGVADPLATSLSIEAIQPQVPADVVLLTYYLLGEEIIAFLIGKQQFRLVRGLSATPVVQQLLQRLNLQWDRFNAGRPFVERHLQTLELSTRRLLIALHDALMAPIEHYLDEQQLVPTVGERKLVIVPHGLLHQVPFQALHNGEGYLLERYAISYAPSATAWALCQKRRVRRQGNALVMGIADPSLPAIEGEVKAVAQQLQEAQITVDLCLNECATIATLPAIASTCRFLHIACHGLFRADNPMFSALKLHDGWLMASDAMQLDLMGALVTLSACETGRSRIIIGDEITGLIRAFLGAGAATLVVSQWLVQDEAAAFLMAAWYEQLKGSRDKAAALRAAQLATKARYPHPYYWAPFILVGQR